MDLSNLVSLYGKPNTKICDNCHGAGCNVCKGFGYIGETSDANVIYTYTYPFYIELKKRTETDFLKYVILGLLTFSMIFAIIISYIVNISNG